MNPELRLLDTSALLAFIEDEAGTDRVEEVLRGGQALLPWVALMETYYVTQQERGQAEANQRYALVKQLPARILWGMDEPTVLTAARLKAGFHISFGDAIVAALAIQEGAILLHKDPEFEALNDQVALEGLPYKKST